MAKEGAILYSKMFNRGFMKNMYFVLILSSLINLEAALQWNSSAQFSTQSTQNPQNIALACDRANERVVAAWANDSTFALYYAVYDGTNWGTSNPIPLVSSNGGAFVNLAYNENSGQVFAIWSDQISAKIYFAIYEGTNWTTPAQINLGGPSEGTNPSIAYDKTSLKMIATWLNSGNGHPYYSIFDGVAWSSALISGEAVQNLATLAYDDLNGYLYTFWGKDVDYKPALSFFNGSTWSSPQEIGGTSLVYNDIFAVFDKASSQLVAAWSDRATRTPYYSIFDGTSWSESLPIPMGGGTNQAQEDVFLAYDPYLGRVVATWADKVNFLPFYSIYNGESWGEPLPIPRGATNGVLEDVYSVYYPSQNQMVAAWSDHSTSHPFYSYTTPQSIAPTNVSGNQRKNQVPLQEQYFNTIIWSPSPSPEIVYYNIYRDGVLTESISVGEPLSYTDYEINWKEGYTYSVTAVDLIGVESEPINIFIQ